MKNYKKPKRPLRNQYNEPPHNLKLTSKLAKEIVNALTTTACPYYINLPKRNCGSLDEENCEECWQDAINFLNSERIPDRSAKLTKK